MTDALLGTGLLVLLVLSLSVIVLLARAWLLPSDPAQVTVNGQDRIQATTGDRLLATLDSAGIHLPAACGGKGTCGQCRVQLAEGSSAALPSETARLSRREIRAGMRLACQVVLRGDLAVSVDDGLLKARSWDCEVISSRAVAPLIRELTLQLPEDQEIDFRPGAFVQVSAPAYVRPFTEFEIAVEHRAVWDALGLNDVLASSRVVSSRAYSIANTVADGNRRVILLVRLALPPPRQSDAPPGIVSSYLFGLRSSDRVQLSGPFGQFAARQSERETILIGGGVGMAPLRAIISDQLERQRSQRRISFWYGARSAIDLFYVDEFDRLQAAHANFNWTASLSDPDSDPDSKNRWSGATGFIHDVLFDRYLRHHPAAQDCEYYLCGPPLMIKAVLAMLGDLGVDPEQIYNDDFGT